MIKIGQNFYYSCNCVFILIVNVDFSISKYVLKPFNNSHKWKYNWTNRMKDGILWKYSYVTSPTLFPMTLLQLRPHFNIKAISLGYGSVQFTFRDHGDIWYVQSHLISFRFYMIFNTLKRAMNLHIYVCISIFLVPKYFWTLCSIWNKGFHWVGKFTVSLIKWK